MSSVDASDDAARPPPGPKSPNTADADFPLCGTLTSSGYSELTFIVPRSSDAHEVTRYEVVAHEEVFPPLETNLGWWMCVTDGEVVAVPEAAGDAPYGKLKIRAIVSDQTNGEKGQE